jgi:hypothetical protein
VNGKPLTWPDTAPGPGLKTTHKKRSAYKLNLIDRWNPTGKPVAHLSTPVGRNPEQEHPAETGDRVEELES